jgi:uncharacterized membrane protein YeaQ/YmgE (transglycosylase-associated protein family)
VLGWIIAILVGALIGWLASLIMKTDKKQGPIANILVGIAGAAVARWLFGGVLGIGGAASAGSLSLLGLFWGVLGAVILIYVLRAAKVL